MAYAESALAAQALVERVGGGRMAGFLTELAAGTAFDAVLQRFALTSYAEFQSELAQH